MTAVRQVVVFDDFVRTLPVEEIVFDLGAVCGVR